MYIPLFNKSNYTLLSSLLRIDDLVNYAKNNNIPSIALTDTNMFGTMEFIKKCEQNNIKPIIGLNILLDEYNYVLLAKSYDGYKNLIKLSTIQNERKVSTEDIKNYNKELIALLPFNYKEKYQTLNEIYEELYLGYENKNEQLEALVITQNIVFLRESLYLESNDSNTLTYLYLIRDSKTITDEVTYEVKDHELHIRDLNNLTDNTGLINTLNISEKCNVEFPTSRNLLPKYDCDDPEKYLCELCKVGLSKRLNGNVLKEYQDRLFYELKVINEMGFPNYFLVVYDFIRFAKKNKILVGPGRGSAAGSLVAYSLGITEIDPIKYDLLFERFLNPERKTMPDIDTDFPDNKRELVIDYVKQKYGQKRVSGIITFGTLAAKQVIRDVSRVLNIPLYKVDSLTKLIQSGSKDKLSDLYKNNLTFKTRVDSDILLKNMLQIAMKLEGFPRHTSSHAAGIVMSQIDLDEVLPLIKVDDMYLTSYSMEYLEELGLLKMDFLVIKNLTMIDNIINDIKKIHNIDIDFSKIPLDDEETLNMFKTGNTCGVFQFESSGMRNFLKNLKPSTIDDVFAAIALFRPGAAVNIDEYIKRKHGESKVTYLDDSLEEITKNTYGILIYQEQIMQLANIYAGYSLGEADILRKAMSKKKVDILKAEEEKFIRKSVEKGHDENQAKHLFELVLNFAGYGFNKSHSVVYSVVAYKMAYLKCHFRTIFFANLMTNVIGSESKTNEYILEAKANKIEIEKPTINNSDITYIVKDENTLIYPISNIKSIGTVVSNQIKSAKEKGNFIDIFDCISRLCIEGIGKKTLETLILANVFTEFGYNRQTLIYNLDSLYNYAELTKDLDLTLVMKPDIEIKEEYSESYLLEKEKEIFGFYLSSHPTTMYKKANPYCIPLNTVEKHFNKQIDVLILVEKIKIINTKKGDKMAFITGSDETGSRELTLFPNRFKEYPNIEAGDLLKVRGNVEKRLNEYQIIIDKVKKLEGDTNE